MKVAVLLFKGRVAPHFGVSSTFLFLETKGVKFSQETVWNLGGEGLWKSPEASWRWA